jgi:hypothetical protein
MKNVSGSTMESCVEILIYLLWAKDIAELAFRLTHGQAPKDTTRVDFNVCAGKMAYHLDLQIKLFSFSLDDSFSNQLRMAFICSASSANHYVSSQHAQVNGSWLTILMKKIIRTASSKTKEKPLIFLLIL